MKERKDRNMRYDALIKIVKEFNIEKQIVQKLKNLRCLA